MKHVYNTTSHELKLPHIVDSQGVYVFDERGKRYMDLESGVWCISVGHNNKQINETISRQSSSLLHAGFCYSNEVVDLAAESVLEITGMAGGKCVFLCSGSEAIEISRQISKHLTGKTSSMTLQDSYLGAYSAVSDRSRGWFCFDWNPCKTCSSNDNCDPDCENLKTIPGDIADFVFEPGSSSGFVRFPPKTLIRNIVNIVRQNGGKIVANEVTTGIGRTGLWFGYQHYDIQPDMVAMGKGIGNGYPVSVAAINRETIRELGGKPFKYAQSHENDPLGAAVVREVIRIIKDEGLITKAMRHGPIFMEQLDSLVDHEIVLDVRGRGLMFAMDLDKRRIEEIFVELIDMGFIVGNRGSAFRIDPPLILTESEFEIFIDAFKSILAKKKKV